MRNSFFVLLAFTLIPLYTFSQMFGGQLKSSKTGTIGSMNCGSATNIGNLTTGTAASGVSSVVPYTGGNGGAYNGQTVSSTGVTGLTATLTAGNFANGAGSLTYTITGTPSASGTASFALNIGGQSCTLSINVLTASSPAYPPNSVFCANGPTSVVEVTNPATGRVWMDRNLGATQAATSSTDANAYGDLYQWGRRSDGHQCRTSPTTNILSSTDQPANGNFILAPNPPNDWRSPQNTNLWQGVIGVNNPCPSGYGLPTEAELETERFSWSSNNDQGAFASPLKLSMAGSRSSSGGSLLLVGTVGRYWSSSVNGVYSPYLYVSSIAYLDIASRANGFSVRCIKDVSSPQGSINNLDCGLTTNNGTLTSGTPAIGVSFIVPYSGGNGGTHSGQTVSSTGVTGLTASLTAGTFANGAGSLTYTITGTPISAGMASFALNIGGQSCTLSINVLPSSTPAYPSNSVFCANGPTSVVEVTNPTTGRIWMDRNLGATQVAANSTDANAYGDLYQWGRRSDGHQCRTSNTTTTLSSTDQPTHGMFILYSNSPFDWRNPQNANLWQGVSEVNNPCPDGYSLPTVADWTAEQSSWSSNGAQGAFASPLKLSVAGERLSLNGSLNNLGIFGYYWSRATGTSGVTFFSQLMNFGNNGTAGMSNSMRSSGLSVRCIKDIVSPQGSINTINCGSATNIGNLTTGAAASGVSSVVPYTGGNGGAYNGQTVSSTGVTGLTATLTAGNFANGAGSLTYTITGTPSASGTASFALNIGGQSCNLNLNVVSLASLYPVNSVFCNGPTAIVEVANPATGRIWMDRNLGANQVATSSTDSNAYGELYQWGRRADGHQCRTSNTTTTFSSTDQPVHGNFILALNLPFDWRSPQNTNLWQGLNGINNPCPSGYRLPTEAELEAERLSWSSNNPQGAFASPLKLPMAGWRHPSNGSLSHVGIFGCFWSSTIGGIDSRGLVFLNNTSGVDVYYRGDGFSVRCIKD